MNVQLQENLANRYLNYKLYKTPQSLRVRPEYLVHDGRKRAKIVRDLVEDGYVTPEKNEDGTVYVITDKAYREWPAASSIRGIDDFAPRVEDAEVLCKRPGVYFNNLSTSERKTIVENLGDYLFFNVLSRTLHEPIYPATFAPSSQAYMYDMYVSTGAYIAKRAKVIRQDQIARLARQNVANQLVHMGIVSKDEESMAVRPSAAVGGLFLGNADSRQELDIAFDEWLAKSDERIANLEAKLAEARTQRSVIERIGAEVERIGGKEVFKGLLEERIGEYLDEQAAAKASAKEAK